MSLLTALQLEALFIVALLLPLLLQLVALYLTSRALWTFTGRYFGRTVWALFALVGVPLHELSHAIAFMLTGAGVRRMVPAPRGLPEYNGRRRCRPPAEALRAVAARLVDRAVLRLLARRMAGAASAAAGFGSHMTSALDRRAAKRRAGAGYGPGGDEHVRGWSRRSPAGMAELAHGSPSTRLVGMGQYPARKTSPFFPAARAAGAAPAGVRAHQALSDPQAAFALVRMPPERDGADRRGAERDNLRAAGARGAGVAPAAPAFAALAIRRRFRRARRPPHPLRR